MVKLPKKAIQSQIICCQGLHVRLATSGVACQCIKRSYPAGFTFDSEGLTLTCQGLLEVRDLIRQKYQGGGHFDL